MNYAVEEQLSYFTWTVVNYNCWRTNDCLLSKFLNESLLVFCSLVAVKADVSLWYCRWGLFFFSCSDVLLLFYFSIVVVLYCSSSLLPQLKQGLSKFKTSLSPACTQVLIVSLYCHAGYKNKTLTDLFTHSKCNVVRCHQQPLTTSCADAAGQSKAKWESSLAQIPHWGNTVSIEWVKTELLSSSLAISY